MKFAAPTAAAVAILLSVASAAPQATPRSSGMVYSFSDLNPTADLMWTPCYDNFTCALLQVPLDYEDLSVGTTKVAIIKKPSSNASAEDLLVNPGGPGSSGVNLVLNNYGTIAAKVGSQFNIVGIDPRGVNNSGPDLDCFRGYSPIARNAFYANAFAVPDNTSEYGLARSFQLTGAYGDWCSGVYSVNGTAKYANTVAVAHDFLHYIELREKGLGGDARNAKLWYYGVSYGTVLGATFASLFPDRIARMILDGVVDSEEYYNGKWDSSPSDTDQAVRFLFQACFAAGPDKCAFHQQATSSEELEQRYLAIMDSLRKSPIAVGDPLSETTIALGLIPTVVTWQDLMSDTLSVAILPRLQLRGFVQTLAELETGKGERLAAIIDSANIASPYIGDTFGLQAAERLITCLDANGRSKISTIDEYRDYVNSLARTSEHGGLAVAGNLGAVCRKLDILPPKSQVFEGTPGANKTSVPILWIGNTADPMTPLRSAKKMASLFPESRVLTFNTTGHASTNTPSKCITSYTQRYMLDASLPPQDAVCEPDDYEIRW